MTSAPQDSLSSLESNISTKECSGASDAELARYDAAYGDMRNAIAVCYRVSEVKDIRDKAKALEVYAAQAMDTEAERRCCEIRLRAERRAGELLREMKEFGSLRTQAQGRPEKASSPTRLSESRATRQSTLSDIGISYDQSSKWQRLADIPEAEFEEALAQPCKPSTDGLLSSRAIAQEPQRSIDIKALNAWGRICDFERGGLLNRDPQELFSEMTETMREDVQRLAPQLIEWLRLF